MANLLLTCATKLTVNGTTTAPEHLMVCGNARFVNSGSNNIYMGTSHGAVDIDFNRAASQDLKIRTYSGGWNEALRILGTCVYACTCLQSPVLRATTCAIAHSLRQTTNQQYLCLYGGCDDSSPGGILLRSCGGTSRGYLYYDGTSNFGLLNCSGQWAIRIVGNHSSNTCMYTCHPLEAATSFKSPIVCATSCTNYGACATSKLTSDGNNMKHTTQYGFISLGPANSSWAHINTDRNCFYIHKPIAVDGGQICSYDEDLILQRTDSTSSNRIKITSDTTHICQYTNIAGKLAVNAAGCTCCCALNCGKADFEVQTGGTGTIALSGAVMRVGSNDVNWSTRWQSSGYFETYSSDLYLKVATNNKCVIFCPHGSGFTKACGILCTTTCVQSPILCATTRADINCICSSTGMARSFPTWSTVGTRYLPQVTASANLPVGWYTIFVNTGNRAGGRFVLRDTTGSRHQYVVFYASHSYGNGNSINVLQYSRYSGQPIQCVRVKDFDTYSGAALQVYVCDATNNLVAYEAGDNVHANGWYFLNSWCCDACVPYSYSCFNACWPAGCYCDGASVNLHCIQDGGQILTGKLYAPVLCATNCVQSNHLKTCCCICFTQHNIALHATASHLMALCSNDASVSALRFDSNAGVEGYAYADNKHIGFLDADGSWMYLAKCDACHQWRIDNATKMQLFPACLCHCAKIEAATLCAPTCVSAAVVCSTGIVRGTAGCFVSSADSCFSGMIKTCCNLIVGAGGVNRTLSVRHIDGKCHTADTSDTLYLQYSTGCPVIIGGSACANTTLYLYGSLCACPANYNPACFKTLVGAGDWNSNCSGSTIWHTNHNYWYKLTNCGKSGYWICSDVCANQYWRVRNTSGSMVTGMMLGCAGDFCACICAKSPIVCGTTCVQTAKVMANEHFSTSQLWSSTDMKNANFWVCTGDDSFKLDQGSSVFDIWVSDSSISHQPRNILRAYNQGNCIVLGQGCNANTNATIPVYACNCLQSPVVCGTSCVISGNSWLQSTCIKGPVVCGTSCLTTDGCLKFTQSTPYICTGGAYIIVPGGIYVNGGTFYAENTTMHRNGICDDTATILDIWGGCNSHKCTNLRGKTFVCQCLYVHCNICLAPDTSGNMQNGISLGKTNGLPQASWGESGTKTGRIEIGLPTLDGEGGTVHHGMVHVAIDVYEYNSNDATTIIVGGHNWNCRWYNCGAHMTGGCTDKTIKLAYHSCGGTNNGRYVILLGECDSSWTYGSVHVRSITNGLYYCDNMNLGTPWYVKRVTCADSHYNQTTADLRSSSNSMAGYQCAMVCFHGPRVCATTCLETSVACASSVVKGGDWVCGNRICSAGCVLAAGCIHGDSVIATGYLQSCSAVLSCVASIHTGGSGCCGLAVGQTFSNEGGWHNQLNTYGSQHNIIRIKKAAGDASNNAQCLSLYVHNSQAATIISTGNLLLKAAGGVGMCLLNGAACSAVIKGSTCVVSPMVFPTGCLQFDQSGTRSWKVCASSGNLNFHSGDGSGTFYFHSQLYSNILCGTSCVSSNSLVISPTICGTGCIQTHYYRSGANNMCLCPSGCGYGLFLGNSVNGEKQHWTTAMFTASGTQARRAKILEFSYNTHHWDSGGRIIIEIFRNYYGKGSSQKWQIVQTGLDGTGSQNCSAGDDLPAGARDVALMLLESNGPDTNQFKLHVDMHAAGFKISDYDIGIAEVYLDVDYYAQVAAKVTLNGTWYNINTGASFTTANSSQYKFYDSPSISGYTNISTFHNAAPTVQSTGGRILYADRIYGQSYWQAYCQNCYTNVCTRYLCLTSTSCMSTIHTSSTICGSGLICANSCLHSPIMCFSTCLCATAGCIKVPIIEARYSNANTNHRGGMCWNSLQLGNNGVNTITAGQNGTGGYLDIYTNTTNDMLAQGTNNGVHTARFHTTSGNAQTCLYGTTRTSALYASSFVNSGKFCASASFFCSGCIYVAGRVEGCCHVAGSSYFCNNCLHVVGNICSTTGFYGDGSNLTGVGGGLCGCTATSSLYQTAVGQCAMNAGGGIQAIAIGYKAAQHAGQFSPTDDNLNMIAIGTESLNIATTSCYTVAMGYRAGYDNVDGKENTYIGSLAGQNNDDNPAGAGAVFLGYNAGMCVKKSCGSIFLGACSYGTTCAWAHCCIVIGNSLTGSGCGKMCSGSFTFTGSVSKSSGSFRIVHPNPAKSETKDLWHSFVESPNEGDNLYRFSLDVTGCRGVITLPNYYRHLNKNDQIWVSPVGHFGAAYGTVTENQECAVICTNADGCYNVLLVGTRKDRAATHAWKGTERDVDSNSPHSEPVYTHGEEDEHGEKELLCTTWSRDMAEYNEAYD